MGVFVSAPAFFGLRVASGLLLLKLAANFLTVGQFANFTQFLLVAALLNLMALGGAQNGLIRQAAAAAEAGDLARTRSAAFLIWGLAAGLLGAPAILASGQISDLLVGARSAWPVVAAITLLSLATGPGQIFCSLLSGRQRPTDSLIAQALGLGVGTALAAWAITRGEAGLAAIGFASGGVATILAAFLFERRLKIVHAPLRSAKGEVGILLSYSAATAATASFSSMAMFGLRLVYRGAFGATALGYWMAANRISDMSTQLLGLFMIQFFVPHLAATPDRSARRLLVVRSWVAGAAVMGAIAVVFTLASRPLVHLLLSDAFLPAIPAIRTYMVGDFFRVWASLSLFTVFAQGRPARSAAIEISILATMAAITLALVWAGQAQAPQLGYVGAYAATAIVVTLVFLRRAR